MRQEQNRAPIVPPGILLGIGFGGFVDGILLHQILQWHHMVSSPYPPDSVANLNLNTLWDGLFHAAVWVVSLVGLLWFTRAMRRATPNRPLRVLVGALLFGWGLFNLVEGIVDHFILGIHHVRDVPDYLTYDIAFIVFALLLMALGWLVLRRRRPRPA